MTYDKLKRFLYNFRHLNSMEQRLSYLHKELETANERENRLSQQFAAYKESAEKELHMVAQQHELFNAQLNNITEELRKLQRLSKLHPIRVVFLCEQPSLWSSFRSIVSAMLSDSRFEVILIRLWCKRYAHDGSYTYETTDFCKIEEKLGMHLIDSYDERTGHWLDLEELAPEYVFYMRPYDYYRHTKYHIETVSSYAQTCYIPYGIPTNLEKIDRFSLPQDFCTKVNYFFTAAEEQGNMLQQYFGTSQATEKNQVLFGGYPPLDIIREMSRVDRLKNEKSEFTILWLPRWNTSEGICNFFEYRDLLVEYATHQSDCHLIFRPHPMCFQNFLSTGELTDQDIVSLRQQYQSNPVLRLDEKGSYLPSFAESDVLVADPTSLIGEYILTEKPVVFCKRQGKFTSLMETLMQGMYVVESFDELKSVLDLLRKGEDPLKEIRHALVQQHFSSGEISAGVRIRNVLLEEHLSRIIQYQ
mgnify:FL=1